MKWLQFFLLPVPLAACAQQMVPVKPLPASVKPHGVAAQSTALSSAGSATDAPITALPSFSVTDRNGKAVASASLARTGRWLLLYRKDECISCDRLMNALAADPQLNHGASYVVVVDAASSTALEKVRSAWPAFSDAVWLADTGLEALSALQLKGTPVLFAMHGNLVSFHVPGTLGDPAMVERMAGSWMSGVDSAATASVSSAPSKP